MLKQKKLDLKDIAQQVQSGHLDKIPVSIVTEIGDNEQMQHTLLHYYLKEKNESTFNFIKNFKFPWTYYLKGMSSQEMTDFFELVQKNNIDLFAPIEHKGKVHNCIYVEVADTLFRQPPHRYDSNDTITSYDVFYSLLSKPEFLQNAFINAKNIDGFVQLFEVLSYHYSKNLYFSKNDLAPTVIDNLTSEKVAQSDNYKKLLDSPKFINSIFYKESDSFNELHEIAQKPFFAPKRDAILTALSVAKTFHNTSQHQAKNAYEQFEELHTQNKLHINPDYHFAYGVNDFYRGTLSDYFPQSYSYNVFKKLLQSGKIDVDTINQKDKNSMTFIEQFIEENLYRDRHDQKPFAEKALSAAQEIKDLIELGISPVIKYIPKSQLEFLAKDNVEDKTSAKYTSGGFISNEIKDISRSMHMPPEILQELVNFLDKRYHYQPQATITSELNKQVNATWSELIDKLEFKENLTNKQKLPGFKM